MSSKEKFTALVMSKGYKSMREFCIYNGFDPGNMQRTIEMDYKARPQINRVFDLANALAVDYTKIMDIFYGDKISENRDIVFQKSL